MRGKLGGVLAFILLCTGILYARYTFQIYKEEVFLGGELIENKEEVKNLIRDEIEKRDELQTQAGFYEYSEITIEIDVTKAKSVEESTKLVLEKIKLPLTIS